MGGERGFCSDCVGLDFDIVIYGVGRGVKLGKELMREGWGDEYKRKGILFGLVLDGNIYRYFFFFICIKFGRIERIVLFMKWLIGLFVKGFIGFMIVEEEFYNYR